MTTNGRGPGTKAAPTLAASEPEAAPDLTPSGVFRAARTKHKNKGWMLAAQYIESGYHYCVFRRPLEDAGPQLTKREADAVTLASSGLSNKGIASELDVSPSTVGVLLFRAAAKLGAKSRSELIAKYRAREDL